MTLGGGKTDWWRDSSPNCYLLTYECGLGSKARDKGLQVID